MTNRWRWVGSALVAASIVFLAIVIFPDLVASDSNLTIGPLQFIVITLDVALLFFGATVARKVRTIGDFKMILRQYSPVIIFCVLVLAFDVISLRIYIQGKPKQVQVNNLRWAVNWFTLAIVLFKGLGINIKRAIEFIRFNYGAVIMAAVLVLSLFSDVFRAAAWVYSLFLAMGFGISLWLISPKNRLIVAPVFAPVIGYAITSVLGSWLVMLDLPVKVWAISYTITLVALNLLLVVAWVRKNPSWRNGFDWKSALNDVSLNYLGIILVVLPIAIGGLKFSFLRSNPWDAQNYMSMAFYLLDIPFSLHIQQDVLSQINPAILWGGGLLDTRWTTSMLMAYSSFLGDIPIYRFDFAFSALPFAFLLGTTRNLLKGTELDGRALFLLAVGISAGYYGQVALDIRAVSYCTSLPVVLAFVFLVARIWDDHESYLRGSPIYFGEIFLLILLTVALSILYPEILPILGLGILIGMLYYAVRGVIQVKKAVLLFLSAVLAVLIIYVTLPLYINFFIGQIAASQGLYSITYTYYFSWIFNDFPAGVWGLSPYQLNDVSSAVIQIYAYILTVILAAAWGIYFIRRSPISTIIQMSGFITTAGALLFAYLCFSGQYYWQAGKVFTYGYPFMMIFIASIPQIIQNANLRRFPVFYRIFQKAIFLWLVLLAISSVFRFLSVIWGGWYPFYVGGTDMGSYNSYNWETQEFIDRVKEPGNVVWLASSTNFEDMFWALSMPTDVKVSITYPVVDTPGTMIGLNPSYLSDMLPDYLIVSNNIWLWNNDVIYPKPVLADQRFSLIKLSRQLPDAPLLVGIRNTPFSYFPNDRDFGFEKEGWLMFLSPRKCQAVFSGNGLIEGGYSSLKLVVNSRPLGTKKVVSFLGNHPFQFFIPLAKGYNFISIEIMKDTQTSGFPTTAVSFQDISIHYSCEPQ